MKTQRIASEGQAPRSPSYRWYVLFLLTGVYVVNFIDRQVLGILQESIKEDLGLTDLELGLLTGFTFAIFYALMGIPIARLADRFSRKRIITVAIAVWSLMTALCGTAANYAMLFLYRVGVGIGEAGGTPPAHSLISDYFARHQRTTALGIYTAGFALGAMFGVFAGGWLDQFFGWRMAFMVVGLPGLLIALLVHLTLREPPRGLADGTEDHHRTHHDTPPFPKVVRTLWQCKSFRHLAAGAVLHAVTVNVLLYWSAPYYIRVHAFSRGETGSWLALFALLSGLGIFVAGWVADRLAVRDVRWYMWLPALALLVMTPLHMAQFLSANATLSVLFALVPAFLFNFDMPVNFGMAQSLVSARMRATAAAGMLFLVNFFGLAFGPPVTGFLSDLFTHNFGLGTDSLRYVIPLMELLNLWAIAHYLIAAKYIRADFAPAPAA